MADELKAVEEIQNPDSRAFMTKWSNTIKNSGIEPVEQTAPVQEKVEEKVEEKKVEEKVETEEKVENELTQEQIDSKLEEIKNKKPEELSEEDKEFYDQNKPKTGIDKLKERYDYPEIKALELENNIDSAFTIVDKVSEIKAVQLLEQEFEQNPVLEEFYQHHVIEGKSVDSFKKKYEVPDYSNIDIKSESGQEQMYKYYYQQKGLKPEHIDILYKASKAADSIGDEVKGFKTELDSTRQAQLAVQEEAEAADAAKRKVTQEQTVSQINKIISSRKLGGIELSETESKQFQNYIFGIDKESRKPLSVAKYDSLSIDQKLMIDFIIMKDFKVKGLASSKEFKAMSFDDEFAQNKNRNTTTKIASQQTQGSQFSEKSLKEILGNNIRKQA